MNNLNTTSVKLPIGILLRYREFDRIMKPAPKVGFLHHHTVDEVKEWILDGNECEPVELSIDGDKALLTDGNHRTAAMSLIHDEDHCIDVNIKNVTGVVGEIFYDHTIKRFKKIDVKLKNLIS